MAALLASEFKSQEPNKISIPRSMESAHAPVQSHIPKVIENIERATVTLCTVN
jgi:hypothetical protein